MYLRGVNPDAGPPAAAGKTAGGGTDNAKPATPPIRSCAGHSSFYRSGRRETRKIFPVLRAAGRLEGGRRGESNGGGEIRTHGTLAGPPVFKTGAFGHSATPPGRAGVYSAPNRASKKARAHPKQGSSVTRLSASSQCPPTVTRASRPCMRCGVPATAMFLNLLSEVLRRISRPFSKMRARFFATLRMANGNCLRSR